MTKITEKEIKKNLKSGGIGVLPTDTIYGLVGSAQNITSIERIKKLKKRSDNKPFIVLISKVQDLEKFNIHLKEKDKIILEKIWPSSISVALSAKDSFRWPIKQVVCPYPRSKADEVLGTQHHGCFFRIGMAHRPCKTHRVFSSSGQSPEVFKHRTLINSSKK